MKKTILLLLFAALARTLWAANTDIKQMWLTLPDSIVPYLSASARAQLVDYQEGGELPKVENAFSEETRLTALTSDYLSVELSASSSLAMKLLPTKSGEQLLCMIRTYAGPLPESKIAFYDTSWQEIKDSLLPELTADSFLERNDTTDDAEWQEARRLIDTHLMAYELSAEDNLLEVKCSPILLSGEQQTLIDKQLRTREYEWNGERFNISGDTMKNQ